MSSSVMTVHIAVMTMHALVNISKIKQVFSTANKCSDKIQLSTTPLLQANKANSISKLSKLVNITLN